MHVVLLTADTDCDGTSYGAHRITVPDNLDLTDPDVVLKYAQATDQMSSYYDCVMEVLELLTFRGLYFPSMRLRDRLYFNEAGYTSHHMEPNWNPWVYDDSIGIPALDHTYDD